MHKQKKWNRAKDVLPPKSPPGMNWMVLSAAAARCLQQAHTICTLMRGVGSTKQVFVTLTFNLDLRMSEQGSKHIFLENLPQIRSAVPKILVPPGAARPSSFSFFFVPGALDLWQSNSSEQGSKHVFPVNLAQIHSAVPGTFDAQTKKMKKDTALKTEPYLRAVISKKSKPENTVDDIRRLSKW